MTGTRHGSMAPRIVAALLAIVLLGGETIAGLCAIDCLRPTPANGASVRDGSHHCGTMQARDESPLISSGSTCSQHTNARLTIGAVATRLSHVALPAPAGWLMPSSSFGRSRVLLAPASRRGPAPPIAPLPLRI